MKSLTLRIADSLWQRMLAYHFAPGKHQESASFLYCNIERVLGGMVMLAPPDSPYLQLAPDCFKRQSAGNVCLRDDVQTRMLVDFAASRYNCLVNIHDHWFDDHALFSSIDDAGDRAFDSYLRQRFEPMLARRPDLGPSRPIHHLSIVLGKRSHDVRLTHGQRPRLAPPVRAIWRIGERLQPAALTRAPIVASSDPVNVRQSSFLGSATALLANLHVGIAGCGGLGSILAESLGRLGVRQLTLVDDDRLEASNLNRWQGATPANVGLHKAELLASRLCEMFPGMRCVVVPRGLIDSRSQAALAACDLLIGALDNDVARFQLSHMALQWMQPYFDGGVGVVNQPQVDFCSRYFAVVPGVTGCVRCKGFKLIDDTEVAHALANPALLAELRSAGYVVDAPTEGAPSSYLLNQRCAATVTTELLNFLTGWRPLSTVISESWRTGKIQRADRENFPEAPDDDCPLCSLRLGAGSRLKIPGSEKPLDLAAVAAEPASEPVVTV